MTVEAMPRLAALQDADHMKRVFEVQLRTANGAEPQIQSCQIDYIRQSNARLVVQYTLQIAHPVSGQVTEQIVTGTAYSRDRASKLLARLRKADPESLSPLGAHSLLPISYVSTLDLLIQVFPYDYRLPGLLRLFQGADDLAAPLLAEFGSGDWQVERWAAASARYRPDMRAMVRVEMGAREVPTNRVGVVAAFAKVYRDGEEGRQAQQRLQLLWEATERTDLGFTVARPIAYIERWQTLLLGEAPGTRLLQLVRSGNESDAIAAVQRAARAVAGFHQFSFPVGVLTEASRDNDELLATFARKLTSISPDHGTEIEQLVDAIAAGLAESPVAPTHFDLKQGHMLLGDGRVTLLDLDKAALGDPLIDVANFVATLGADREGSERRGERRAVLTEAFITEYFAHVPSSWRDQFPARLAMATLAEAATTGRGQRGRTGRAKHPERAAAAVERARNVLAGQLW